LGQNAAKHLLGLGLHAWRYPLDALRPPEYREGAEGHVLHAASQLRKESRIQAARKATADVEEVDVERKIDLKWDNKLFENRRFRNRKSLFGAF